MLLLKKISLLLPIFLLASCKLSEIDGTPPQSAVTLYWNTPTERANGEPIEVSEIGGYVIRYRVESESNFTYVRIPDNSSAQYSMSMPGNKKINVEVAAYDTNGVFGKYVAADIN